MKTFYLKNENMGSESFSILEKAAKRRLEERELGLSLKPDAADYVVTLTVDASYQNDRYTINANEKCAALCAANDLSLHAAFGRLLLESTFDGRGAFTPYCGNIDFTPKRSFRGMYFATHNYNFYQAAPLHEVFEVIEDIALRGCNVLQVWFDMHNYNSMQDEAAQKQVGILHEIIHYANRIGIAGMLVALANEGFASSPVELRAEWAAQGCYHHEPQDHYHVELCPSKEGGIEEILKERREMLAYFADLDIKYVSYGPYDQGGCTCMKCQPWGPNGFVKLFPHFQKVWREFFPKIKFVVSTWHFDWFTDDEWDQFYPHLTDGSLEDVAYYQSFFFRGEMPECLVEDGVPDGVKLIDFTEISMYTCLPYGGFGVNCLAKFLQLTLDKTGYLYEGGTPYSEGIFEDINKFIILSWYSGLYLNTADAVRAYVKFEFCVDGEALDELTKAFLLTETGLARQRTKKEGQPQHFYIRNQSEIETVREILLKYDPQMPEKIRKNFRFRLLYLRAMIDHELVKAGGYPLQSEECQKLFHEVNSIYYASDLTDDHCRAPEGV